MRPRVFPAEDYLIRAYALPVIERASMRPRVFPAEDSMERRPTRTRLWVLQ